MTSMDWYFGNNIDDFVVPNDQELEDGFTSPENWSKWGVSAFGNMESSNKCSVNMNLATEEVDYQLDELSRFQQTDNIFWNSMIEDLQGTEEPDFFSQDSQHEFMPSKDLSGDVMVPSEKNGHVTPEPSLEESVLGELETVMTQLNDETRICFRDAFYRLAKNSEDNLMNSKTKLPTYDSKIRSERQNAMESETNTIDRAIASLTFNKMEANVFDFPLMDHIMTDSTESPKHN